MNDKIKESILCEIKKYDTIIISRHQRPDGDAVGSSLGLAKMLKASFPRKRIFVDNEDYSEYVAFLGSEGEHPTDDDYINALAIVVDTGNMQRISNKRVTLAKKLVKIDHHIDDNPYGDISWVEDERSSTCEMIVDFYMTFHDELVLDKDSATCLYAGMVTDSGRFRFRGTDSNTMLCASELLKRDIDTETLFANLYIDDYDNMIFRAKMAARIKITENGVAWLHVSRALRKRRGLSLEEASNIVSIMDSIKGSLIWIAFIENDDGSTRVRLRSRFVEVQELATHYHGGGHACASGATVYSKEEEAALLCDADKILKKYKSENDGWI